MIKLTDRHALVSAPARVGVNTLSSFSFNDLLPQNLRNAPIFKAASACLDRLFEGFDERVKLALVYSRIDELDNQQLDDLAWQFNIGYFEGYNFAETLEDKRVLVKHAIQLHWHKGTKWALESIPIYLGMPTVVIEWFDADLLGTQMAPYQFDLAIDTGGRGTSPTIHDDVMRLVNNLKNVRSYLRNIILIMAWRVTAYYGAQNIGINYGMVRPKITRNIALSLKYGRAVAGLGAAKGRITPKITSKISIAFSYYYGVARLSMLRNRVIPKRSTGGRITLKYARIMGHYGASIGRVTPKSATEIAVNVMNNNRMGGYSATIGRVYPK